MIIMTTITQEVLTGCTKTNHSKLGVAGTDQELQQTRLSRLSIDGLLAHVLVQVLCSVNLIEWLDTEFPRTKFALSSRTLRPALLLHFDDS